MSELKGASGRRHIFCMSFILLIFDVFVVFVYCTIVRTVQVYSYVGPELPVRMYAVLGVR